MSARPLFVDTEAMPLRIGKYRITGLIGEGSMGVVYRAQDPDIQRSVAIKTIRPPLRRDEQGAGPAATRQFRIEAQAAGRLNHPNIVGIYEYGEYGEQGEELFIAMECIDGPSLSALARQGQRLSLPDVMAVMLQLLDALHCAHEQRVWHCDIKPSNLLLTPDGRIKVTDFGIARVESSDMTLRNALWGSPGYMAPERYAGGAMDQRVDLFSCGVLLYELLTGSAPFVGSASAVMYQVLQRQAPAPSSLPDSTATPELDAIVARALAKHPGERYASAHEMRQALLDAAPALRVPRTLSRGAVTGTLPPPASAPQALMAAVLAAAAPDLTPTVASLPSADVQALTQLEALLRPTLGAVSRAVVRDANRRCVDIAATVAHIAEHTLTAGERTAFLAAAAQLPGMAPAQAPGTGTGSGPRAQAPDPSQGRTPLRPETVDAAARLLARQIGPIAMLLARRAAADASCREQFFDRLAAGADVDRAQLLPQLERLN